MRLDKDYHMSETTARRDDKPSLSACHACQSHGEWCTADASAFYATSVFDLGRDSLEFAGQLPHMSPNARLQSMKRASL